MAKTPALSIPSSKVAISLAAGSTDPAMKAADAKAGKVFNVPLAAIKPIPGFNVRVDTPDYRAHRDMIGASIAANGFDPTKPLAGFVHKEGDENVIYVTDGHTRLDAVNGLDEDKRPATLPVIVRSPAPSIDDLTVALHTNNTGRPLSPFELGVVVKRLLKTDGADKGAIAARLSVTPRYLDDVLLLVNSPKAVRTAVLEGNVSSTMAIQELRKAGDTPDKAAERITAAVEKAKAAGKTKATAKDTATVKMQKVRSTVSIADGTPMQDIVKAVAAKVREAIAQSLDGEGDDAVKLAAVDGTINLVIEVPAPAKAAAPIAATAEKAVAAAKKADKPKKAGNSAAAEPVVEKPKKPRGKKAAETAPAPAEDENITADDGESAGDDLGIPGATEVASDDDGEIAMVPPAVKSGEGVASDEDPDI